MHLATRYQHRLIVTFVVIGFSIFVSLFSNPSHGAYTVSEYIYKKLNEAQRLADNSKPQQAANLLEQLVNQTGKNAYERAMILNQLAYIYYQQNRVNQAIEGFETLTTIEEIPEALKQSSLYTLAQIYYESERYHDAIATLRRWFKLVKKPSEDAYAFLAQAYYQTNNHKLVVDNLHKAIEMIEAKNLSPVEQWLLMLQSSYSELGLIEHRVNIMKWLIRIYPKREYFLALSTAYGMLDKRNKQLSVLEIAYQKGFLENSSEFLTLASLLFSEGAPYKAAKVLQQAMDNNKVPITARNLKFLASAWISAQEFAKSIPILKKAASLSTTGEIDVMVGNSYLNLGEWQNAADAFQKGLAKGGIREPEKVWLLVGQCFLNAKQFATAEKIFEEAIGFESVKEKAEKWLRYTTLEKQRYQAYQELLSNQS